MKKINEVSQLAGVSKRTLQYYDDQEVLVVKRTENNHRLYDDDALQKIWQIMIYKEMGFDLKEIKNILMCSEEGPGAMYELQIQKIRNKMKVLREKEKLIAFVWEHGMPELPEEKPGKTYAQCLEELKESLSTEKTKGEENTWK